MQSHRCLNCDAPIETAQNFCATCGQKTDVGRLHFKTLLTDFFQTLFNVEKGILHLLKGLVTTPGTVAANYAAGKRKQYFNPFGFLALSIAVTLLLQKWLGRFETLPTADKRHLSAMPTPELKELAHTANDRALLADNFFHENMNIIMVLVMPLVALMLWLFFRSRRRNLAEITTAYLLFTGFATAASSLLVYLPMSLFSSYTAYTIFLWLSNFLQLGYFSWGMNVFFGYASSKGFFKVFGVLLLTGFIGFLIVLIVLFLYVYSGSWELLHYTSQHPL